MNPSVFAVFDGIKYRWNGWGGCQLETSEWRRPPAGTERHLDFGVGKPSITVKIFTTRRVWPLGKCQCTWAIPSHGTLDQHNARIWELKSALKELW